MIMRLVLWAAVLSLVLCVGANAGPIPIIGVSCTGFWDSDRGCSRTFDGVTNDFTPGPGGAGAYSYWLGRGLTVNETLTFDLGALYTIDSVDLWNTHNQGYNDRGTTVFRVWVSPTPVTPDTSSSSFGTLVASGTLLFPTLDPNPMQGPFSFTPVTGQYVTFRAVDFRHTVTLTNGAGLSEIVINGVPEPATVVLLGAGIGVLLPLWRRRAS